MAQIQWTFCESIKPDYEDLLQLGQVINFYKSRMLQVLHEPYANGYADDNAQETIDKYVEKIDFLQNEYCWMLATIGLPERVG